MEKEGLHGCITSFQTLPRISTLTYSGSLYTALCPYQLKPCLLEGVYFSRRAVSFRREYFCSRFICATDWQLICSDAELRLGRWELWKLCHLSLCLRRRWETQKGQVTEMYLQNTIRNHCMCTAEIPALGGCIPLRFHRYQPAASLPHLV